MQILTLDFETYFAQDYTLSKLTTEEYIRSSLFQIIGVGVKINDGPGQWFSGSLSETREWLFQFDLHEHAVIAHNAMFDMAILNWKLGIRPKLILDTLSMARPIHGSTVGGSLAKLVAHYKLGTKGTDTTWAKGLRREDFTAAQLQTYGGYCATREDSDCNLTWRLFHKLLPLTPRPELLLIDATVRLFTEPRLALDRELLESHLSSTRAEKERLLLAVSARATIKEGLRLKRLTQAQFDALSQRIRDGDEATITLLAQDLDAAKKILMSNPQMAELLIEHGVEPPRKISPTTGKGTWAFAKSDKEFSALLEHDDPAVQAIVAARLGVKSTIEETRTERLIGISTRGLLPVPLAYSGAVTSQRWAGTERLNLQNLRRGGALRRAVVALPGNAIVVGDMANIELRVNHCLAGQTDSIAAFVERRDLYTEFAARLFNKPASEITKDERFLGKLSHLSLGYGCGYKKFREICRLYKVDITDERAIEIVSLWRYTYRAIPKLWDACDQSLNAMANGSMATIGHGPVILTFTSDDGTCGFDLASGHRIRYADLKSTGDGWTYYTNRGRKTIYGGKIVENLCQSISRHILGYQWLLFADWLKANHPLWAVVLQVHDELVATGPEDEAPAVAAGLERALSTAPPWWPDLPLAAEVGWAKNYGEAKS